MRFIGFLPAWFVFAPGMVAVPKGPEPFDRLIVEDMKFWQSAVEIAKIEKQ